MAAFLSESEFDFRVRLPTHSLTVKAGQAISIPVVVGTIKGKPRPVTLSTSDWRSAGVSAEVVPSTVPSGRVATLYISVSPDTAPGSYLLTVRGSVEGTFNTSNDSITITVEPRLAEEDGDDGEDVRQGRGEPEVQDQAVLSPSKARPRRAALAKPARKKAPDRPVPAGRRALLVAIMLVMAGVLAYYLGTQFRTGSASPSGGMAGSYVGTSTFCIYSVMGNDPDCGTDTTPEIQIDSAGNVLGPVLFGAVDDRGDFHGEAHAGDGATFPMTGEFSNGALSVSYVSSSVTWTITLHRQ